MFKHNPFLLPLKVKMSTDANKGSTDSHPTGNGTSAPPPAASDASGADDTAPQADEVADDPAFKDFFSLAGKIVEQDPTQLDAMKNTAKLIASSAKIAMEGLLSKAGLDPADIDKKGITKNSLENYLAVHALVQEKNEKKKSGTPQQQQQQAASTAKRPKQSGPALGAPEQAKKSAPPSQTDGQHENPVQKMHRELMEAYLSGKS